MDVTGPESDWRSNNFRQKLVSQIDEAMRKAGVAHNKSSKDMESHVFMKAKTRVKHLSVFPQVTGMTKEVTNNPQKQQTQCTWLTISLWLEYVVMKDFGFSVILSPLG
uniref:Mediator of RNA polymerase II transcription subunit 15 n=1 Tax=Dromaius novaehollandiae TaxID=8790 RepID=A0A8C4P8C7_DRONO